MFDLSGKRIWVAGAHGMVGAAITRALLAQGHTPLPSSTRARLDLRDPAATAAWMRAHAPDLIFLAAARVGGIMDNADHPADFITDNLQIQSSVISAAARQNVQKLVFLGSSCIYPKDAPQPLRPESLLTGPLEETNRAYAIAKLAGLELVRANRTQYGHDFISVLPCNLYGTGDTYDARASHVIPAIMLKVKYALDTGAPHITLWGTGKALREFMHVDDMADACIHLARHYSDDAPVNIGTGTDISIHDLAVLICGIAGYTGKIRFDETKPDGVLKKCLDISPLSASSWRPKLALQQGLAQVWHQVFC